MINTLPFGRTGHLSTRIIFGAYALAQVTQAQADRALERLTQYGINHIDTASGKWYGDSELRIGPWMERYRDRFFLATKMAERTYQDARDEFHLSLERLRVDRVDLLQLHHVIDPQDWEVVMGSGGALEAAIEARQQGLTRFIGVTGHGLTAPVMHRRSLERFDFDSVLLPYNYLLMQDPQYAADFESLAALCQERGVAVQTIKAIAHRQWGDDTRTHPTWYRPLESRQAIALSVHWALAHPDIFVISAGSLPLLPKVLDAASSFGAIPPDATMEQLVADYGIRPIFEPEP
jgi:aryl-alcohol dehydrogenase-like predicted oxidoreductase